MKTILVALVTLVFVACSTSRDLEVEMVSAQLIKIDTVYRPDSRHDYKQLLTWRDEDDIEYKSFASMRQSYRIGTVMTFLKQR